MLSSHTVRGVCKITNLLPNIRVSDSRLILNVNQVRYLSSKTNNSHKQSSQEETNKDNNSYPDSKDISIIIYGTIGAGIGMYAQLDHASKMSKYSENKSIISDTIALTTSTGVGGLFGYVFGIFMGELGLNKPLLILMPICLIASIINHGINKDR
jgi:hypothetical protein